MNLVCIGISGESWVRCTRDGRSSPWPSLKKAGPGQPYISASLLEQCCHGYMKNLKQYKAILALICTIWYQTILRIVRQFRDWKEPYPLNTVSLYSIRSPLPQQWKMENVAFCPCSERRSKANLDFWKVCICLPSETSSRHLKSLSWERYLHSTIMVQKCIVVEISHKLLVNIFKTNILWILQWNALIIVWILDVTHW